MPEYNYSPLFLKAHEELVNRLIDLAKSGQVAVAKFDGHQEARNYRVLILNLKRSLAINQPNLAFVHNQLRTAISRDETGWWLVNVGNADTLTVMKGGKRQKVRGAHQLMVETRQESTFSSPDRVLGIQEEITKDNWETIAVRLSVAKVNIQTEKIIIAKPPDERGIEFIADKMSPEFKLVSRSPMMVLERIASANVALDSERKEP